MFQKFSNRKKNIRDAGVLGWGWSIFPNLKKKNKGARRQSCQQLKRKTPNIDGKVTNVKKRARNFIIHTDVCIASSSKLQHGQARFSLSVLLPSNVKRWAVFLPSGPGQHTLHLAFCERRTKKIWESLLPCSAAWQVSWLNLISLLKFPLCDWRLHFHSLKCDPISFFCFFFVLFCFLSLFRSDGHY